MESNLRKLLPVDDDDHDDDYKKGCSYSICPITPYDSCSLYCKSVCEKNCVRLPISIAPPDLDSSSFKSPHKLSTLLICTIALLSFTFFLVICYAFYVRFYSGRLRRRSPESSPEETHQREFLDEEHGPVLDHPIWYIRTVGLQASVISSITVCKFKNGDGLIDGTECSVCLSEFEEDENVRLLPKCNHAFHIPCIDTWLRSHTNCPMCRAPIVIENSGQSQEPQIGNLSNFVESREEDDEDDGVSESSVIENDDDGDERRERCDDDLDEGELRDFQPLRRSVSLDYLSALKISSDVANLDRKVVDCVETESGRKKGCASSEKSGSNSMKRSVSCSGKFLVRSST